MTQTTTMSETNERGVYQCIKCKNIQRSFQEPSILGCDKSFIHAWNKLADNGTRHFLCIKCLNVIHRFRTPKILECSMGGYHIWNQLKISEVQESKFISRGTKNKTIIYKSFKSLILN